jgi:hypothetical protein
MNMKSLLLLICFTLLFGIFASALQKDKSLSLPKIKEVARITTNMNIWHTPESLLKLLPLLIPIEGTYLEKVAFQRGAIELKDGRVLLWMSAGSDTILIYSDKGEQLYKRAAQNDVELYPIIIENKLGYMNASGKIVIKPQFIAHISEINGSFDDTKYFNEGIAGIQTKDSYAIIDRTGRILLNGYSLESGFIDGLARICKLQPDGPCKFGYMDKQLNIVIKPQFDRAEDFSDGLALVQLKNKWGFIDRTGKFAIEPRFKEARSFSDGLAFAAMGHYIRLGYINKKGKFIQMPDEVERFGPHSEGLISVKIDDKWGFINIEGKIVIEPQFEPDINEYRDDVYQASFANGLAAAKSKGKWGFINREGKFVIAPKFDKARQFNGNIAAVSVNGKWGLINRAGEFVQPAMFDEVQDRAVQEGFGEVSQNGKWGFVDQDGRIAIKPQFNAVSAFSDGLAAVCVGEKWGYIDTTGKIAIEPQFISAGYFDKGLALQMIKEFVGKTTYTRGYHNEWGYINKKGKFIWKTTDF